MPASHHIRLGCCYLRNQIDAARAEFGLRCAQQHIYRRTSERATHCTRVTKDSRETAGIDARYAAYIEAY